MAIFILDKDYSRTVSIISSPISPKQHTNTERKLNERYLPHMWVGLWKLWWTEIRKETFRACFTHYFSITREDVNHSICVFFFLSQTPLLSLALFFLIFLPEFLLFSRYIFLMILLIFLIN